MTQSDQQLLVLGGLLVAAVATGFAVKPKKTSSTATSQPGRAPKKTQPARVSGRGRPRRRGGVMFPR